MSEAEAKLKEIATQLQSDKGNGISLEKAYHTLHNIAKENPELADQVFGTFKTAIQSDKNSELSLIIAYHYLSDIVEADPTLVEQVLDTFETAVQSDRTKKATNSNKSNLLISRSLFLPLIPNS